MSYPLASATLAPGNSTALPSREDFVLILAAGGAAGRNGPQPDPCLPTPVSANVAGVARTTVAVGCGRWIGCFGQHSQG